MRSLRLCHVTRLEGKKHRDGLLQCNKCREQFTVTVGTVFERSKIPLNKWLLCNHLLCAGKKGVSAHQIRRMLGVNYKTAWFMSHLSADCCARRLITIRPLVSLASVESAGLASIVVRYLAKLRCAAKQPLCNLALAGRIVGIV